MAMPTKEQMEDFAYKTWESTKEGVSTLKDAGMFEMKHVMEFTKDLGRPINKEYVTAEGFQKIVLAKTPDLTVSRDARASISSPHARCMRRPPRCAALELPPCPARPNRPHTCALALSVLVARACACALSRRSARRPPSTHPPPLTTPS